MPKRTLKIELENKIIELEKEIETLKKENYSLNEQIYTLKEQFPNETKKHNERNAGRRKKLEDIEIESIIKTYKDTRITKSELARTFEVSRSTIAKIIKQYT